MKTKFLLTMMMVYVLHAKAQVQQIQITREDFPKAGTNFFFQTIKRQAQLTDTGGTGQTGSGGTGTGSGIDTLTAGATGPGATWDFSKLSTLIGTGQQGIDTVKILTLANWNTIDTMAGSRSKNAFPTSNLVEADKERIQFLLESQDSINILGLIYVGDTNVQRFTPPLSVARFPVSFNSNTVDSGRIVMASAFRSSGGGTVIDPDSIRTTLIVTSRDTADAWGTIKTPTFQYQALRVITYKKFRRTYEVKTNGASWIAYKSPSDSMPIADTIEYKWWAKGIGKEVFSIKSAVPSRRDTSSSSNTIAGNTNDSSIIVKVAWYTGTSSVTNTENSLPASVLTLAPNPNTGSFSISGNMSGMFTMSIQDLQGRQLYADKMQGLNKSYDLSLAEGMYCVKITAEDGRSLVKKIVVTR